MFLLLCSFRSNPSHLCWASAHCIMQAKFKKFSLFYSRKSLTDTARTIRYDSWNSLSVHLTVNFHVSFWAAISRLDPMLLSCLGTISLLRSMSRILKTHALPVLNDRSLSYLYEFSFQTDLPAHSGFGIEHSPKTQAQSQDQASPFSQKPTSLIEMFVCKNYLDGSEDTEFQDQS